MAISKAQQKAVAKYNASNYDRIEIKVPKGRKQVIIDYCQKNGESVNGFITKLVDSELMRLGILETSEENKITV